MTNAELLPFWQREISRRLAAWGSVEELIPNHDCMAMISRDGFMYQLPIEEAEGSVSLEVVSFRDGDGVELGEMAGFAEIVVALNQ